MSNTIIESGTAEAVAFRLFSSHMHDFPNSSDKKNSFKRELALYDICLMTANGTADPKKRDALIEELFS